MLPSEEELTDFLEDVSAASRLIDGLKAGTITPEYVDQKIAQRSQSEAKIKPAAPAAAKQTASKAAVDRDAAATDTAKQADLLRKVEELKANRQRKIKARQQYESYVQGKQQQHHSYTTDYNQWELWCPSDEEDDLFNSLTPNSPEFRAMEQDISRRHARMVEQRQIAERQRQLGNEAFKAGQFSEALRCYEQGLESQRHNMTLHANAAMAALKLKCYVAAQEHCDKVLHLAEVLHNTPKHPLCVKALQRRAAAHQGLGQHSKAVEDLQAAAHILPGDAEVLEQLKRAKVLLEEHKTAKRLARLVQPKCTEPEQQVATPEAMPSKDDANNSSSSSSGPCAFTGGISADVAASESVTQQSSNSSTDTSGTSSDVVRLKRIKQLVDHLNSPHSSSSSSSSSATCGGAQEEATAAARTSWTAVAVADCEELLGLLREPQHSIFFRNCDGVAAMSKLVNKSATAGAEPNSCLAAHAFKVVNAACDSDTAVEQLSDQVLGAALDFITSQHAAISSSQQGKSSETQSSQSGSAAALGAADLSDRQQGLLAALDLAYSASMCSAVRRRLCGQLVKPAAQHQHQQQHQQQGRGLTQQGSSRLLGMWEVCCSPSYAAGDQAAIKVTALSLLSNCLLVATVRNATLQLLQQQEGQQLLTNLTQLMATCILSTAVKVFGLLSNMCNHTGLRAQLGACQPLLQQLLQAATTATAPKHAAQPAQAGSEYALAVLGCLFNLSLEQEVQQMMAQQDVLVGQLLRLAAAGPQEFRCATSSSSTCGGDGRPNSKQPTAGPRLPPRGKVQSPGSSNPGDSAAMAARAATLLSRVAKQAGGVMQLQQKHALGVFAPAIPECLTVLQDKAGTQNQQQGTECGKVFEAAAEWLSAAVRTMALITAAPGACSSCSADTVSAVIIACCQLLRNATAEDAAKGNAALVIKSFAADGKQQWHPVLAKADAVEALISAARAGKGSPSSKNAGIALAVLARAGSSFIERLRELRGLEVLYEYVKP